MFVFSLQEALPLSSKYLLSGANQTKVDVAAVAAENRALRDAMEQQRFKRKVASNDLFNCLISCLVMTA